MYFAYMDKNDDKIRLFFKKCISDWTRTHGRAPLTMEEMWDAVDDGIERRSKETRS